MSSHTENHVPYISDLSAAPIVDTANLLPVQNDPGEFVRLKVVRDEREIEVKVRLGSTVE